MGHSYGGCVALQLAAEAPELVHSLALLEPGLIAGEHGPAYYEALASGPAAYREAGAEATVDGFLETRWPGYRERLERRLPGAFARAVEDAPTWFELEVGGQIAWRFGEAEVRKVDQPTLAVVGGRSDALWPRFGETQRLLLEWLPQAEGYVLPDATHFLHLEGAEQSRNMASALADFLSRHPISKQ